MRVPVETLAAIAAQVKQLAQLPMTVPQISFAGFIVQLEYREDQREGREIWVTSIEQAGSPQDAASRR